MEERVSFNVGGSQFTVHKDTLRRGPASKLTRMYEEAVCNGHSPTFDLDRPADSFAAIMAFYQTGELHMPANSCPGAFVNELEFWGLGEDDLTTCCHMRLQNFYSEQKTVQEFQDATLAKEYEMMPIEASASRLGTYRRKVWSVVDNREKSVYAKIYFIIVTLMVTVSILTMALSTDPSFQRLMTNCERLEYMEAAEMDDLDAAFAMLGGQNCADSQLADPDDEGTVGVQASYLRTDDFYNEYEYHFYNNKDDSGTDNGTESRNQSQLVQIFGIFVKLPNMRVRKFFFVVMEIVVMGFFTVDLLLRLFTCPSVLRYYKSLINIADTAALLGSYAHLVVVHVDTEERYRHTNTDLLSYIQVLRALRLLRLANHIRMYKALKYSMGQSIRDLLILALFLIIGVCTFASLFFVFEGRQTNANASIPLAWWWALVTMTTVGYGDVYPATGWGKMVASVCAVSGVVLFAMTIPIFVSNFLLLYQYTDGRGKRRARHVDDKTARNGVVEKKIEAEPDI